MRNSQKEAPSFYREYQPLRSSPKPMSLLTPNKRPISASSVKQTHSTRATGCSVNFNKTPSNANRDDSPFDQEQKPEIPRNLIQFSVSCFDNWQSYFKRAQQQVSDIESKSPMSPPLKQYHLNRDKTPETNEKFLFERKIQGSVKLSDKKKYLGAYFLKEKQDMFDIQTPPTILKPKMLGSRPTSVRQVPNQHNKENIFIQALANTEIEEESFPAASHSTLSTKDIAQERKCNQVNESKVNKHKMSPSTVQRIDNIQVLLNFEKLFFEFTQQVMHHTKGNLHAPFNLLEEATCQSLMYVETSSKFHVKSVHLFRSNCQMILLSMHIAKVGFGIIVRNSQMLNHYRCLVISIHQNILYLMETLTSSNQNEKIKLMKQKQQTANDSLNCILCHNDILAKYQTVLRKMESIGKGYSLNTLMNDLKLISNQSSSKALSQTRENHQPLLDPEQQIKSRQMSPQVLHTTKVTIPDIQKGRKYTLVMDLDETLIHYDPKKKHVNFRPYARQFVETLSQYFEIIVFTAAQKTYADIILDKLDPKREFITHRLYRESCIDKGGVHIKDLAILGRDLSRTIIVDNIKENFQRQPTNGIHIESFYNNVNDRELEALIPFLKGMVVNHIKDVRNLVKLYNPLFWKSKLPSRRDPVSKMR